MLVIVCGQHRSGTTLLQRLLDIHPEVALTYEMGTLFPIGKPLSTYCKRMLQRWWQARNRSFLSRDRRWLHCGYDEAAYGSKQLRTPNELLCKWLRLNMTQNLAFMAPYLLNLSRQGKRIVSAEMVEESLRRSFQEQLVVGDKHPDYIWILDRLTQIEELRRIVIYRDPRDVVSSSLLKARTSWKKWMGGVWGSAEQVASHWVRAIKLMEKHEANIYTIRYELLVTEPTRTLRELADCLGVSAGGFSPDQISDGSVGKHQNYLTVEEVADVLRVAGPEMNRLGYE